MNARKSNRFLSASCIAALVLSGCGSKDKTDAETAAPATNAVSNAEEGGDSGNTAATTVIAEARTQIKSGDVDQAAAKLAQLQSSGTAFNAQQAKDYRQALSEAYDRAIEGAQRGDARAQAALQLLRAAGPR